MLMLLLLTILVILPVAIGYAMFRMTEVAEQDALPHMRHSRISIGDRIVYQKTKFSPQPPPRAHHVSASAKGENYVYLIDKYWVVTDVLADGMVVAQTRRGKLNHVRLDDPNLRKAGFFESRLHPERFPEVAVAA